MNIRFACMALLWLALPAQAGEPLRIAVASNFAEAMDALILEWAQRGGEPVQRATASTGKLYAQIVHGAPYDLFFAADAERPQRLETAGRALPGSRFTYAVGRLALWSPDAAAVDPQGEVLRQGRFRFLAIANPRLAPYGRAARQLLESMGLWRHLQPRLVRGENIGQTFHFVVSGNAELGLVAWSQLRRPGKTPQGSWWLPPRDSHQPIEQQAVLLSKRPVARAFIDFVRSDAGRRIIREYGYDDDER